MKRDQEKGGSGKKDPLKKNGGKKSAKPHSEREENPDENKQPAIRNFVLGKKRLKAERERSQKPKSREMNEGVSKKGSTQKGAGNAPDALSGKRPGKFKGDTLIRLNRYISNAGICSRRDADLLIEKGEIKVNGKVVTEMGHKVKLSDTVTYRDKALSIEKAVYILLNKPKNFITTTDDPEERKTVMQLVSNACEERIYPVGRLDRNTTGLIVLTNDGDLAKKLSHPSHEVKKLYQVDLDRPLAREDFLKIQEGVMLEDGRAEVDEIAFVTPEGTSIGVELHIGRNRIVRRIFEHLGYEVVKLDRVMYAGLDKKDLPRGEWRFLREKEILRLKRMEPAHKQGGKNQKTKDRRK